MEAIKNQKMETKDLITVAIFTLLFTVCMFVFAGVMGMLPSIMLYFAALASIPCGLIYMYLRIKVPKKGAILIQSIVMALIYFSMGMMWTGSVGIVIGGLVAEKVAGKSQYQSLKGQSLGYVLFIFCFWVGMIIPIYAAKDYYIQATLKSGMDQNYIDTMLQSIAGVKLVLAAALTFLGASLGALLGRKALKKHTLS